VSSFKSRTNTSSCCIPQTNHHENSNSNDISPKLNKTFTAIKQKCL